LTDQEFLSGRKEGKPVTLAGELRLPGPGSDRVPLDPLAKHPRIDPARIPLMGFSRGGVATLYASVKRFQRMHDTAGQEFAAYIAFYPSCGTAFREDEDVTVKPIRLFHGDADDYVPVGPCRTYVERLKRRARMSSSLNTPARGTCSIGKR
jgi:dienelactone hydrolase